MAIKTILLKSNGIRKEAQAAAAITPGHLVELTTAGKFQKHSTSGGASSKMFAIENELIGKNLNVDWITNEQVVAEVLPIGAEVYALLPAAAAAVVIGDLLMSNGDGTLIKYVNQTSASVTTNGVIPNRVVARALQAVDNSGGGSPKRIVVEVQ